jgi:hypothetical protein
LFFGLQSLELHDLCPDDSLPTTWSHIEHFFLLRGEASADGDADWR